jgi:hypothetical protein
MIARANQRAGTIQSSKDGEEDREQRRLEGVEADGLGKSVLAGISRRILGDGWPKGLGK